MSDEVCLIYGSKRCGTIALVIARAECPQAVIDIASEGHLGGADIGLILTLLDGVDYLFAPVDYRNIRQVINMTTYCGTGGVC